MELSISNGDSLYNLTYDMFHREILKRDATKAFHPASSMPFGRPLNFISTVLIIIGEP
jgi:hypothetical protein